MGRGGKKRGYLDRSSFSSSFCLSPTYTHTSRQPFGRPSVPRLGGGDLIKGGFNWNQLFKVSHSNLHKRRIIIIRSFVLNQNKQTQIVNQRALDQPPGFPEKQKGIPSMKRIVQTFWRICSVCPPPTFCIDKSLFHAFKSLFPLIKNRLVLPSSLFFSLSLSKGRQIKTPTTEKNKRGTSPRFHRKS